MSDAGASGDRKDKEDAGRLFLAVPLPDAARQELDRFLGAVGPLPGRPVAPQNWHFTLRFLGQTSWSDFERVSTTLSSARLGNAFSTRLGGLGAFPQTRAAKVLWIDVDKGQGQLLALARQVEALTRLAGLPAEPRPFQAHLTVSRLRPAADVSEVVDRVGPAKIPVLVSAVVLYRSSLGSGIPRYEQVSTYPLDNSAGFDRDTIGPGEASKR